MNKQEKAEPDFSFVLDAVKELQSSNAYWRKRCEAAEAVIESMECGITNLPTQEAKLKHEEKYNHWLTLKKE